MSYQSPHRPSSMSVRVAGLQPRLSVSARLLPDFGGNRGSVNADNRDELGIDVEDRLRLHDEGNV